MKKKLASIVLAIICILSTAPSISYCQEPQINIQYFGTIQGEDEILDIYDNISRIRKNISTTKITSNSSKEELQATNNYLDSYTSEFRLILNQLNSYKNKYKNSRGDQYVAETITFIVQSYIIGIMHTNALIDDLIKDNPDAKYIFESLYSSNLYYYFQLGDNQMAYFKTYFTTIK